MINSGIKQGTPARIPFGAGVFFSGVTYDENVAPTEADIKSNILGATQDGSSLKITPELFTPPLDGALVKVKELEQKVGETAVMDVSYAEMSAELAAKTAIGKKASTSDGRYDVVTSSGLTAEHFYEGFGFCGYHLDGREIIIIFKNALCTSGFSVDQKNKNNAVTKATMECYSDIEYGVDKLPYAIFIKKADGAFAAAKIEDVKVEG